MDNKILYQVIKRGDGTFYPNIKNTETGREFGAWNGYRNTYDEAYTDLRDEIREEVTFARANTKQVVFEGTIEDFNL